MIMILRLRHPSVHHHLVQIVTLPSVLIIDQEVLSVNIVIELVAVVFFFSPPLRVVNATAKSSNRVIFKFLVLVQQ